MVKWRKNMKSNNNYGIHLPCGVCDCEQLTDDVPCSEGVVGLVISIGICCCDTFDSSSDFLI